MTIVIGLLTLVLILDALLLILLVLIQLPKKEAGAGVAFGGGATDALFGAGSGSALTKITKYAATAFLALSMILAVMNIHRSRSSERGLEAELNRAAKAAPAAAPVQQQAPASNIFTPLPNAQSPAPQQTSPAGQTAPATTPAAQTTAPANQNTTTPAKAATNAPGR
ncbi:MAG TPA: preprotein translocase subunit SecG [Methylomirabilota bacterium]|nr:preprotein translocase subunit SecG [Methylomirabilota bacterium]